MANPGRRNCMRYALAAGRNVLIANRVGYTRFRRVRPQVQRQPLMALKQGECGKSSCYYYTLSAGKNLVVPNRIGERVDMDAHQQFLVRVFSKSPLKAR